MSAKLSTWSLVGLCLSMALAVGGGLYEHVVLTPLWSSDPPASFAVIQPGTGVPQQRFWIPVHSAITIVLVAALVGSWRDRDIRRALLLGLASYAVMRVWSAIFFIPEMLAFQQVPLDAAPSAELLSRVKAWTTWTWWREPLDVLSFASWGLAFSWSRRPSPTRAAGHARAA